MSKKQLEKMLTATFALNYDLRYFVENGVTWWVAVDVAKILEIEKVRNTLANFPDDEKKLIDLNGVTNTAHSADSIADAVSGGWIEKKLPDICRAIFFIYKRKNLCYNPTVKQNFTDQLLHI